MKDFPAKKVISGLQEQIAEMHILIERLKVGAAIDRYTARIELSIEPTYAIDQKFYCLGPEDIKLKPDQMYYIGPGKSAKNENKS